MTIAYILRIVALVILVMAATGVPSRVNLIAAGLAVWVLSTLV